MVEDGVKVSGVFEIDVLDAKTRVLKERIVVPNLVLSTGLALIAGRLVGLSNNTIDEIGVGDSNAAVAADQTDLQAGANKTWKSIPNANKSVVGASFRVFAEFASSEANYTWREIAIRDTNDAVYGRAVLQNPRLKTSADVFIARYTGSFSTRV